MARANPRFALRPFLPRDAEIVAAIFRASIEELTEDDYNPSQQDAWASVADDAAAFAERLGKNLTLLATLEGSPVGFGALADNKTIDMLYVHPAVAEQGVGSMLYDALEKLAVARGVSQLTVEASDTAREFFARQGFTAEQRNTISVGNEWLTNTTMKKKLTQQRSA
ncbi:MAG TPA: GNAT family N-acetyltransferase [Xanthobacteraceae bacterium]|nr:GNAT family N-acetyltransferase [Xanthobacteraceae bacterium]